MSCPLCGDRMYSMGNGCSGCGYRPTPLEKDRDAARLRDKARQAMNRTERAVEWAGVFPPTLDDDLSMPDFANQLLGQIAQAQRGGGK